MADIGVPSGTGQAAITTAALQIAGDGCAEIGTVLTDIQTDNILGNDVTWADAASGAGVETQYANDRTAAQVAAGQVSTDTVDKGGEVLWKYGYSKGSNANITQASGAMVIDDLMQKISTKVQVASQMLSTANNINKTASRVISQG